MTDLFWKRNSNLSHAHMSCVLCNDCTCENVACGRCTCLHLRHLRFLLNNEAHPEVESGVSVHDRWNNDDRYSVSTRNWMDRGRSESLCYMITHTPLQLGAKGQDGCTLDTKARAIPGSAGQFEVGAGLQPLIPLHFRGSRIRRFLARGYMATVVEGRQQVEYLVILEQGQMARDIVAESFFEPKRRTSHKDSNLPHSSLAWTHALHGHLCTQTPLSTSTARRPQSLIAMTRQRTPASEARRGVSAERASPTHEVHRTKLYVTDEATFTQCTTIRRRHEANQNKHR